VTLGVPAELSSKNLTPRGVVGLEYLESSSFVVSIISNAGEGTLTLICGGEGSSTWGDEDDGSLSKGGEGSLTCTGEGSPTCGEGSVTCTGEGSLTCGGGDGS